MPKFALAYPFFILMVCLVIALVGGVTWSVCRWTCSPGSICRW